MITINLLPEEYTRRAKSPAAKIAAVAAALLLNGTLLAYYGYLAFGTSANIETTRSVLSLDLDGLRPQVTYHKALEQEIQTRSAREKTLSEITRNRILWTKALDELIDVVHAGRDGIEHFVWFEDIDVQMEGAGGKSRGGFGKLQAAGHSGSQDYDQVANFLEDIEDRQLSGLWQIFGKPSAPEARVNDPEEDLIPAVNWSFPLMIDLLSPDERVSNRTTNEEEGQ